MIFSKKNTFQLNFILLALLFFTFTTRFFRLDVPENPYFDEAYHMPAARLIAANDQRAYEWWHEPIAGDDYHDWLHPPLAKFLQAGSILLLGDNAWGWRAPSAIFGSLLVLAVYFLCKEIFLTLADETKAKNIALVASFLVAMDGLVLVQSRIAMNDIFVTLWMVIALFFITRWQPKIWLLKIDRFKEKSGLLKRGSHLNLIMSGFFVGLALSTKWSALLLLIFLLLTVGLNVVVRKLWKLLPLVFFSLVLLPLSLYLASYSQMFAQGKTLDDFAQLHRQIIWYQSNRDSNHEYASLPHQWVLNLRPVWYWTQEKKVISKATTTTPTISTTANIYALGNPVIHWLAMIVLIYQLGWIVNFWSGADAFRHRLMLLMSYLLFWVPWLFSPRIVFYHLYLPAFVVLSMIMARFLVSFYKPGSKWFFWATLSMVFVGFAIYYPHWTGLTVPQSWAQQLYFLLPSWR